MPFLQLQSDCAQPVEHSCVDRLQHRFLGHSKNMEHSNRSLPHSNDIPYTSKGLDFDFSYLQTQLILNNHDQFIYP